MTNTLQILLVIQPISDLSIQSLSILAARYAFDLLKDAVNQF